MSSSGRHGDLSAVLYLVPFLASGLYGLFLWFEAGFSYFLPSSVYLSVTRDPYVFLVGSLSIMAGVALELRGTEDAGRRAKLTSLGNTLQTIAIASLVLVVISAFYANGFLDVGGAASDFVVGRFGLVFPAVLVLLSYLVTASYNLASLAKPKTMGIIALLLVPVSVYEIGKRELVVGLAIALFLMAFGFWVYVFPPGKKAQAKEE